MYTGLSSQPVFLVNIKSFNFKIGVFLAKEILNNIFILHLHSLSSHVDTDAELYSDKSLFLQAKRFLFMSNIKEIMRQFCMMIVTVT